MKKNEAVSQSKHGEDDESVKHKVKKTCPHLDKEPFLQNVADVTILPPPSKMNIIHKAILARIQDSGVKLENSESGPCLVTVVNMGRDLREARG